MEIKHIIEEHIYFIVIATTKKGKFELTLCKSNYSGEYQFRMNPVVRIPMVKFSDWLEAQSTLNGLNLDEFEKVEIKRLITRTWYEDLK